MSILNTLVSPDSETGDQTDSGSPDFEKIRQKFFGGRNKSSKRKQSEKTGEEPSAEKDLEKIFAGENWEEVASMYFNARFAMTGYDAFLLEDSQKKTLGLSLATTMKMLLKIDPGYIALLVFTANFGGLIAQKEVMYKHAVKEREKQSGKVAS